ncbi:alpha-1,2-fucosyltransferase [sulfur-oxidizing endosymbiont of Gigantopelta aegis]|uniref:alpha-1,2-fucosyltransferase n=1 Tax=sulfur-oxidizing endosymbiont of Gigantopelta aegis TaxID=2794934 RepID=UPI0018DE3011|nr:alpha-1,2-fucosyltransferase [sulfur-oxidizing endosymbiont of Gigantopelta aegis]
MLMLKLRAQTGNNMFQYAACKTLADKKGYQFCFRGGKKGSLFNDFELSGETKFSLGIQRFLYALKPWAKKRLFRFDKIAYTSKKSDEKFDPSFFELSDGYTVQGTFQSEKYFLENRDNILKWYTPRPPYKEQIDKINHEISAPIEKRCCIHIRRSDYHDMEEKEDGLGWILPIAYYQEALKQLPNDLFYIIISDAPDIAEQIFKDLPNKYISRGNPAVVDMFLLTLCRYNIIANSTFSWWGGWLNNIENKVVIAPKYNLGWPDNIWFPDQISVNNWQYIDVNSTLTHYNDIDRIKLQDNPD